MIHTNFFEGYVDHMWRFYVRHMDGNVETMNESSKINWRCCNSVYHRIAPEWRDIIVAHYVQPFDESVRAVRAYCDTHHMPDATAWKIIRAIRKMTAIERGLIEKDIPYHIGKSAVLREPVRRTAATSPDTPAFRYSQSGGNAQ